MTQRNPGEYFVEIDAQRDHHLLVVATGKKSNKTEKRRDIFDFERASSGWALVSLAIRGCNLDCYELIADGRLMQRGEVLRYNIIRAVFGD